MRKALFLSILFFIFLNPFFSQEIVHTEDLIAVELEELEKEKGFTEDEDLEEENEDLEELVTEEPPASLEDKEEKIPHQSLPGIPDEILQRPDVEKFRQQYLSEKWSKLLYQYLEDAMEYRLYVRKAIQEKEMPAILEACDRNAAGPTAPAHGLTMIGLEYER